MTWYPLEYIPRQHINAGTGLPYSGAVLKAYNAQTNTNIPMATDYTGATTATSFVLNSAGYVTSGGNVIIPHVEQACKLALYPTQAAADANSGAVWTYDNIQVATGGNADRIINFAADTGSANAYVIAPDPAITAYSIGQIVTLLPVNTNTGASTLAISGLATKNIKKTVNGTFVNVAAGDIVSTVPVFMFYNGTDFILMGASGALLARGTTLASAATVDLGSADSDYVEISGTTTITSFGTSTARNHVWVKFQAALTLTHNATSLILPGGSNILTSAGDTAEFVRISGGNWQCLGYFRGVSSGLGADVTNVAVFFDDFHYNSVVTPIWTTTVSGTGAAVSAGDPLGASLTNNSRGLIGLSTGTTSTGNATFYKASTSGNAFSLGDGQIDLSWRVYTPAVSTSGQRFTSRIGTCDPGGMGSEPGNGVYFRQVDNVNSGNWQCVCRNSTVESVINTSVAASTAENIYRIVINAAGTSVEFFINGVSQGTITTNIPSSGISFGAGIQKSVGTTAVSLLCDYVYMTTTRT